MERARVPVRLSTPSESPKEPKAGVGLHQFEGMAKSARQRSAPFPAARLGVGVKNGVGKGVGVAVGGNQTTVGVRVGETAVRVGATAVGVGMPWG